MRDNNDPRVFLQDILDSIEKIQRYCLGLSFEEFSSAEETQDAVLRNFTIIGEAIKYLDKLLPSFRNDNPDIEWAEATGMRDIIVHQYFRVDMQLLWTTIYEDIPDLKTYVESLLDQLHSKR